MKELAVSLSSVPLFEGMPFGLQNTTNTDRIMQAHLSLKFLLMKPWMLSIFPLCHSQCLIHFLILLY